MEEFRISYRSLPLGDPGVRLRQATRLTGSGLRAARLAWVIIAVVNLVLFFIAIPAEFSAQMRTAVENYQPALAQLGMSPNFYAVYRTSLDVFQAVAFTLVGLIIFWRKSDDWVVMWVSLASITFGTLFVPTLILLAKHQPAWFPLVGFLRAFGLGSSLVVFYYLFPNGVFTPPWTRWAALGWLALTLYWLLFPMAPFNLVYLDTWYGDLARSLVVFIAWYSSGVFAQIYRYKRVATLIERQQTKWFVFGSTASVAGFILYHAPLALSPALAEYGLPRLVYTLASVPVYHLLILITPLCIGLAVLRNRLWDIDLIINRSLVYGLLTLSLGLVYLGCVALFQMAFTALSGWGAGRSEVIVAASTLVIAALFFPLRGHVQLLIDRRFYRLSYNSAKTLEDFSERVRDEVNLNRLSLLLVEAAKETVQPDYISLWLRKSEGVGGEEFIP